jgi:hypothetical protein
MVKCLKSSPLCQITFEIIIRFRFQYTLANFQTWVVKICYQISDMKMSTYIGGPYYLQQS